MLSIALPPIAAVILYVARMMELGAHRETIAGAIHERWSLRLFVLVGTAIGVGALIEYFVRGHRLDWPWFIAGVACGVASFALRRWAIASLGKYWSLHVEIRDQHRLVREGPFRWMRHPTYVSMLLELLAGVFLLQAWVTLALVPVLYFPALAYRLRLEEAALIEKFGGAYRDYMRQVPALLPWPHRSPR